MKTKELKPKLISMISDFLENPLQPDETFTFRPSIKFQEKEFQNLIKNIAKSLAISSNDIIIENSRIELLKFQVLDTVFGRYEFFNRIIFQIEKTENVIRLREIDMLKSLRHLY